MMRFTPLHCPTCQAPARGTVERLAGVAEFEGPDEAGVVDYSGSTDVWWDEQRTVTDRRGRARLICRAGHEWWAERREYAYEVVEAPPTAPGQPGTSRAPAGPSRPSLRRRVRPRRPQGGGPTMKTECIVQFIFDLSRPLSDRESQIARAAVTLCRQHRALRGQSTSDRDGFTRHLPGDVPRPDAATLPRRRLDHAVVIEALTRRRGDRQAAARDLGIPQTKLARWLYHHRYASRFPARAPRALSP